MKQRVAKSTVRTRALRIENAAVAAVFDAYPNKLRRQLLVLRELILKTAAGIPGVGNIEETLKWNEPAYLTTQSKSGSTIRINRVYKHDDKYALYFNCHTPLVDTFRTLFPNAFKFEGNRAIEFNVADKIPVKELQMCISMALTYHLKKKGK